MKSQLYIVFEGIDGSGKTTQAKLFVEWLRKSGKKVRPVREHSWGPIGTLLRREYLEKDIDLPRIDSLLYAADRLDLLDKEIKPALSEGFTVVSDRNYVSSFAYQGASGVDLEWIRTINKYMLKPDIIVIIDTSLENSVSRIKGEDKFEVPEVQRKVKRFYDKIEGILPKHTILRINGDKTIKEVHEEVKKAVLPFLGKK